MRGGQDERTGRLEQLGLSKAESRTYLALLERGTVGAADLADATGLTRTSVYGALRSLSDAGLVEAGTGYGSRFRAVPPASALPSLIERQRESMSRELEDRERAAKEVAADLAGLVDKRGPAAEEVVEVIRNRRVMSERFDRLQLEAQEEIATLVKAPIVTGGDPNPAQDVAIRRGVRVRGLYERAILEHEEIRPYLREWVAGGEEARIYPGTLPLKLSVIDARVCLVPLETPDGPFPFTTLVIRHQALGAGLRALYESLWDRSEPVEP